MTVDFHCDTQLITALCYSVLNFSLKRQIDGLHIKTCRFLICNLFACISRHESIVNFPAINA
jgi:hypothetical protein